jgi:Zn-dependent peptidase ImmA (M78 family)/DNA-binding XRE family transcriptional regulator
MITQLELAKRLRRARVNVGLSQDDVAAELGVLRPTISQIESGNRGVSSIELVRLASLYRRPLVSFFDEDFEEALSEDPLTLLFRAVELKPGDMWVVEEFENFCHAYRDLEKLLGLEGEKDPLPDYGEIGEPHNKLEAIRQGEKVADEERRRLGLGDDPIRDVFELLEGQGVCLFVRPLRESGISGLFLYDKKIGPCILINGVEHPSRLTFDAAHEYAHVLLDRRLRAHVTLSGQPEEHEELLEVRANRFAAAFLMPAEGIERFLWDLDMVRGRHRSDVVDILYLQRTFGVSYQAALYRLQNLSWIDQAKRKELGDEQPEVLARVLGLPEEGKADLDRFEGEKGYPLRYKYLALEAYQREKISLNRLAELLHLDIEDTRELAWDLR